MVITSRVKRATDHSDDSGPGPSADALSIGRRIRHYRTAAGLTLGQLGERIDRAPSQISVLENGKREPGLGRLRDLAAALGVTTDDLLDPSPVDARQALELEVERNQMSPLYSSLHLPAVKVKSLPQDALEAIAGLQRQLTTMVRRRAATPEEARRVNRALREQMRQQGNHFPELEKVAGEVLARIGYDGGPLSQRQTAAVADHLGYSLHYVSDLPSSTRAVADTENRRLYLSHEDVTGHDPRSHLLTALASHILGHSAPADYEEFLTQRVEANYLSAALMLPESEAVPLRSERRRTGRFLWKSSVTCSESRMRPPRTDSRTSRRPTWGCPCTS